MSRRVPMLVAAGFFLFAETPVLSAQLAKPSEQTATPTATPAGSASPADTKDSPSATAAPKPKKVWTNDDMHELHQNSTVSVVGTRKRAGSQPNGYSPPPGQSENLVKMFRQQIDQLQLQIDGIDKQIANLRDAMNGKTVDSSRTYDPWGGKQGDWNSQIDQLQKNRDSLLKQVDMVEDQIKRVNP